MLVFFGAFLFDVVPFPFPPAFTIMVFLQIVFDLNIWMVIIVGVAISILGRYVLTLYIPIIASKIFKPAKNEDVQYLGKILKEKGWKSQLVIVSYSLLPLLTTPLFIAAGKKDKVNKIDIVGFLTQKGHVKKTDIGLIEVKDFFSFVAVRKSQIGGILETIKNEKIKNKKVKIDIAK